MTWQVAALVLMAVALGLWLFVIGEGSYLGPKIVTALYDRGAAVYDRVKEVLPQDDALHLARPLLSALDGVAPPMVLDIATGTARLPLALLRQWDFQGRVVAIDISPQMLSLARRKTLAHQARVGMLRGDAMALAVRDRAFDAVTCLETLELLPNADRALGEIVRALRPGGQLLLSNRVGPHAPFLPGRALRPRALEAKLCAHGLVNVRTRRWQTHYDLVSATKPCGDESSPA